VSFSLYVHDQLQVAPLEIHQWLINLFCVHIKISEGWSLQFSRRQKFLVLSRSGGVGAKF